MRALTWAALVCVSATLLFAAQGRSGRISGRVWIEKQPAARVQVTLRSDLGNSVNETFTDTDGRFAFTGVERAHYEVTVDMQGYETARQDVDLGEAAGDATVSLFLHKIDTAKRGVQVGSPSLSAKAQTNYEQGHQLLEERKYKEAIPILSEAVAAMPSNADAYDDLGVAYFATRQFDAAKRSWEQALRLNPKLASPAIDLARLANDSKDAKRAMELLEPVAKSGNDSWPLHLELGRAYYTASHWDSARRELDAALAKGGSVEPRIYILLANLDVKAKLFADARANFEHYLAAAPNGEFAPKARAIVADMVKKGIPEPAPATPR